MGIVAERYLAPVCLVNRENSKVCFEKVTESESFISILIDYD